MHHPTHESKDLPSDALITSLVGLTITNRDARLPNDEFVLALACLKIKSGGETLPTDERLRALTIDPPIEAARRLRDSFNERPELLMSERLVQETLARSRSPEFRLVDGYFTIQNIAWGEDKVKAHITVCLYDSPDEASNQEHTLDAEAAKTRPCIYFLPVEIPWGPTRKLRSLQGKMTVTFEADEATLEMTECSLTEKQP